MNDSCDILICALLHYREITVYDLAIPDTYCSPHDKPGYHCPEGMKCMSIDIPKNNRGFNGFDELRKCVKTAR